MAASNGTNIGALLMMSCNGVWVACEECVPAK